MASFTTGSSDSFGLMPYLVAALSLLIATYFFQYKNNNNNQKQNKKNIFPNAIPFPFNLHPLTEILYLVIIVKTKGGGIDAYYRNTRKRLGDVFIMGPLFAAQRPGPVLAITHPDDQAAIMKKEKELELIVNMPDTCTAIHGMENFQHLSSGQKHSELRKIYSSILSPRSLEDFTLVIIDHFNSLWEGLELESEASSISSGSGKGQEVKLTNAIRECQLKLMCKILYGLEAETDEEKRVLAEFAKDFELTEKALFAPGKKSKMFIDGLKARERISTVINGRFDAIFDARLDKRGDVAVAGAGAGEENLQRVGSAMEQIADALIDSGCTGKDGPYDDRVSYYTARENLYLLLEASHETTMYITSSLMYLINHPDNYDTLQRVRKEASTLSPTYDGLKNFTLAEACAQETMRLAPIIGSVPYYISEGKSINFNKKTLAGPATIMFVSSHWYSDPDVFQEADLFIPQRWLAAADTGNGDVAVSAFAKKAFRPFGSGRHICLGSPLAKLVIKANLYCFVSKANRSIQFDAKKVKIVDGIFPMKKVAADFPGMVVCE